MKVLKLCQNQCVTLVPRCNCNLSIALYDAMDFVIENELDEVDLEFEGFTFGIYKSDFIGRSSEFVHGLELEYKNYKKSQIGILTTEGK